MVVLRVLSLGLALTAAFEELRPEDQLAQSLSEGDECATDEGQLQADQCALNALQRRASSVAAHETDDDASFSSRGRYAQVEASALEDGTPALFARHSFNESLHAKLSQLDLSAPYTFNCQTTLDVGEVVRADAKGVALDDTTFEQCADKIPVNWPNTQQKIKSIRLFKAWGMTQPKIFTGDMMKAWAGLKSFAQASGAQFLLGVSITCDQAQDDMEFQAGLKFIEYVGTEYIMGLAVGNEIDLQIGGQRQHPGCVNDIWMKGRYFQTLVRRVAAFDQIPGMSSLPITAVFSNNAIAGSGFTDKVTKFLGQAWGKFGSRFVLSFNVYPQFSTGLGKAGCSKAVDVGTSFEMDTDPGFTPNVVKDIRTRMASMGQADKKFWLGEIGWSTLSYCQLKCSAACQSGQAQFQYYKSFLKWDLTAGAGAEVDHTFYFTLRDSSVFGAREEFGLIHSCSSSNCKY